MPSVMIRFPLSTIRARLLLLILLAIIPALGLILYTASEERRLAALAVREDMLQLTQLVSLDEKELIDGTHQFLSALVLLPEIVQGDSHGCSALLAQMLKQHRRYANLGAIRPDGRLFCSALPFAGRINASDRAYFQRAIENRDFSIGDYQIGRVTGKATINFGHPAFDHNGKLRAIVFAAADLAWLSRFAAEVESRVQRYFTFTQMDRNGVVLGRYPEPEKWTGKVAPEKALIEKIGTQDQALVEALGLDGAPYFYAFIRTRSALLGGDTYTILGIPKEAAFRAANRRLIFNLVGLGAVALLALLAAHFGGDIFILRQVNALVDTTKRLAAGDLSARTGIRYGKGELSYLARTFDDMAESVESNLKRIQAQREIDLAIISTLNLQEILSVFLEKVGLLLPHASALTVRLFNRDNSELEPVACRNLAEEAWRNEGAESEQAAKVVFETRRAIAIRNLERDPAIADPSFFRQHGLVSYLGVPLTVKGEVIGVLSLYAKEEREFTAQEMEFFSMLANQAAIAIQNSQLYEEMTKLAGDLTRSNKVKDEFLSVMSHELRTPLNVVLGYSEMIRDGMLGEINPKQEEALRKILSRGGDLLNLIRDILYATQLEARAVIAERQLVNLNEFLQNLQGAHNLPLGKDVVIRWDYPSELPPVITDGGKLKQILQNIINNAIKFTEKGRITISAQHIPETKKVAFTVPDTGVGIPQHLIPTIFEKFRQVNSSETRLYGGVGLGLYIVKQFTELLGGTVEVESEMGKGSTFTVRIPCGK